MLVRLILQTLITGFIFMISLKMLLASVSGVSRRSGRRAASCAEAKKLERFWNAQGCIVGETVLGRSRSVLGVAMETLLC